MSSSACDARVRSSAALPLVMGTRPIDRIFAVSGVESTVEMTAAPSTLDPLRP